MSGKLDQSLDDIVMSHKKTTRGRGRGRRTGPAGRTATTTAVAPAGGIRKNTRPTKATTKTTPTGPASGSISGDSKIIVSNLPTDVNEGQIKDYFNKSVGPVKKVLITYGPNGASRGVATVIFGRGDTASKALKQLNGLLVDGRPIKIEVVLDASRAPAPVIAKALSERIAQPKNAPRSAAAKPKAAAAATADASRGTRGKGRAGRRGRNAGRAKPKTADELDAEMMDYFDGNATAAGTAPATNGAAPQAAAATNGTADAGMEDEIM